MLSNMMKGTAIENDANNRAAKKLGGSKKMPYTNNVIRIKVYF